MTTKKTIKKAIDETSSSPIKRASVEDGESRSVAESNASGAADTLPDAAGSPARFANDVPNVAAEPNHASQAAEDIRDASVADPK